MKKEISCHYLYGLVVFTWPVPLILFYTSDFILLFIFIILSVSSFCVVCCVKNTALVIVIGILNPTETAERECSALCAVTENLSQLILQQQEDLSLYDKDAIVERLKALRKCKGLLLLKKFQSILESTSNPMLKRCLELNKEKGAGS